jgi:hypothetical protein
MHLNSYHGPLSLSSVVLREGRQLTRFYTSFVCEAQLSPTD